MNVTLEMTVVLLVVAGAAAYLVRRGIRRLRRAPCAGCGRPPSTPPAASELIRTIGGPPTTGGAR